MNADTTAATAAEEIPDFHDDRPALVRDFLIFQLKLVLDGFKDLLTLQLSILALMLDLVMGRGPRRRYFYRVLGASERFDLWLNLHTPAASAEASGDGLFGASRAGENTLLGKLEQVIRGGDVPRGKRGGAAPTPPDSESSPAY